MAKKTKTTKTPHDNKGQRTYSTTITITTPGDRHTGIWPSEVFIGWNIVLGDDDEYREEIRSKLKDTFSVLMDESTSVVFGDECSECQCKLNPKTGKCTNPNCIANLPSVD